MGNNVSLNYSKDDVMHRAFKITWRPPELRRGPGTMFTAGYFVYYLKHQFCSPSSILRDRSLIIRQGGLEEKEQKRCKFSMTPPIKVLIFS